MERDGERGVEREEGGREEGNQLAGKSKDNNNNNAAHALKLQRRRERERESVRERERKVQRVVQRRGGGEGTVLGWLATTSLSAKLPRLNSAFYFVIDLKCVNFRCR